MPTYPPAAPRRALVVDQDADARAFVARSLEYAAITVDEAADAPDARTLMARNRYDVVVSDIDLPSTSGVTLMGELRAIRDVAVVMLSACEDSMFAVVSLEAGADDYCVKPVTARELVLRVEMAIERHGAARSVASADAVVAAGGLVVDPVSRTVTVDGADVDLTVKEFDLLLVLASSPGQVFTRGELLERVWETKPDWQSVDTVTEHVYRLRHKLDIGTAPQHWIQTVRGAGYRFAQAKTTSAPADTAPVELRVIS